MSKIDNERVRACILQLKEDLIKADDELESIMDPEYLNNNMLDIQDLCSDIWGLLVERARKSWKENNGIIEGIRLGAYKVVDVWMEEQNKSEQEKREPRR
jgi:hypothetical protein